MARVYHYPPPAPRACPRCETVFTPRRRKRNQRYCSIDCQRAAFIHRTPERNRELAIATAAKRGDVLRGRGEGRSYIKRNGRHEHRLVAEEKLGRPLLPGEVVHHRDGDKRNNHPDNLEVLPSQSEHARRHFSRKCAEGCDAQ